MMMRAAQLLPAILFILLSLLSCGGKHTPPPGFVRPEITKGHASLVVRIEDGAWIHFSSIAGIETFHRAPQVAAMLWNASLSGGCRDRPARVFSGCDRVMDGDFDFTGPVTCDAREDFPPGSFEAALTFLEEKGFDFPSAGEGLPGEAHCESEKIAEARIDAVRLSRIFLALFSKKKRLLDENTDDRIVNFIYNLSASEGARKAGLCGLTFEDGTNEGWFSGWSPCKEPKTMVIVHGDEPEKIARKIMESFDI
jgi:hypothetical protein